MCVGMCGQTAVTHIRSKCNNKVYLLLLCIAYAKCEEADTDHAYLYIHIYYMYVWGCCSCANIGKFVA